MSSNSLVVSSFTASPVLPQVFPVVVQTASFQYVPQMGGPIPAPVWLAVWDSRTISLSLACAVSVIPALVIPARGTRGMIDRAVSLATGKSERPLMNTIIRICTARLPPSRICFFFLSLTDSQVVFLGGCDCGQQVCYSISFTRHSNLHIHP